MDYKVILKAASTLKKEKRITEACDLLLELRLSSSYSELTLSEKLKIPIYLQADKRSDAAWRFLNELSCSPEYFDIFSQAMITEKMLSFLKREKNNPFQTLMYSIWINCLYIMRDKYSIVNLIDDADRYASILKGLECSITSRANAIAFTPNGNPINNDAYTFLIGRIDELCSYNNVRNLITKTIKSIDGDTLEKITQCTVKYIEENKYDYSLIEIRNLLDRCITKT